MYTIADLIQLTLATLRSVSVRFWAWPLRVLQAWSILKAAPPLA